MSSNPWDKMSGYFDTSNNDVASGAADNILVAWPVILNFIKENPLQKDNLRVLDYGCGGGGFAYKLSTLGYKVIGVDYSQEMINVAKSSYGKDIKFFAGDSDILLTLGNFSVITSIMTLQFIENVDKTIQDLSHVLTPGGLFVFAVFNPKYVIEGLQNKRGFADFDSPVDPKGGVKLFENGKVRVPVYIRNEKEYNDIAIKYGFKNLLEEHPSFTEEYLSKYPEDRKVKSPEYLILGYKKM